uniref:ATP synthase F0 subunit 8 n=1 Tax=Domecia hispida TaxID=652862 RepID=UPI0028D4E306|nr:ATP synthase F0 subunit 8 [Domecia hispida]WMQ53158.1 ATP synthase F0 subunit 8 [Domecia hispida]
MPQMAPMMWSWLFLFFIVCFLLFFMMNYFISPITQIHFKVEQLFTSKKNWKL